MSGKLFGTDGIRGTANQFPMTAEIAMKFGKAAGSYFKKQGYRNRVVIAKDTRLSGYLLEPALTSGFISVGMDVILVGPMPTPAVSMLIKSLKADLGVMISASHNPYQDNGLKLFNAQGMKLSDFCEGKLQDLILNTDLNQFLTPSEELGRAKRLDDAPGRYIEHVKRSFPKGLSLNGLRIVVDCANGAAYHLAPTIFWELGAEVIKIGCEPDGLNINHECGSMHPEKMVKRVLETRADVGICLDGDADRVVMCDEKGKIISGDHIVGIIAQSMKEQNTLMGNTVVVTQMSNAALEEHLEIFGLNTVRTPVGDRYVSEKMREIGANLGGESSGHIILSDYANTGDGMVAALQVLAYKIVSGKRMSEIGSPFQLHPQVIKSVKYVKRDPLENKNIVSNISDLVNKTKDMRIIVRKSGTEKLVRIMVEGRSKAKITSIVKEIEGMLLGEK